MTTTKQVKKSASVLPWRTLKIITKPGSTERIEHLIDDSGKKILYCDECQGRIFEVSAIVNVNMRIGNEQQLLINNIEQKHIYITDIIKCATCGCKDFVTEDLDDYIKK